MLKLFLGIAVGIVIAFMTVAIAESVGHQLYPLPASIDPRDAAQLAGVMDAVPFGAKAVVLAAWFLGALIGGYLANRIADRAIAGWVVAAAVILSAVATMLVIPHPLWMWAGGMVLPVLAAWLSQQGARVTLWR
ncbi:hypothetical protein ACFB49_19450 [Sphingomonas sp. DBB INV C78]|uniref:hypothetical protein n=1 Tax=Sphingomonas sp. DBB INV C78 TaxID=3349434 RepID=UPI0036D26332